MTPRRPIAPDLHDRARRGELTEANTLRKTPERRAVNHVKYERRLSAHPNLSAREASGHTVAGSRPKVASFYTDPPGFVTLEGVTGSEMRRAGIYMASVRDLVENSRRGGPEWQAVATAFERRFRRWAPIAGYKLLADADAVVAVAEQERAADTEVTFDSGRSRPGRRRRT